MGNPDSCCESDGISEDTSMRPDIIDGFERKSVALLDYVNNLEAQLEQLKASFEHREGRLKAEKVALEEELAQREAKLRSEKRCLEEKLHHTLEQLSRTQKAVLQEERKRLAADEVIRNLRQDVQCAQDLLQNERQRSKELEGQLCELKEQLRNREHCYNQRRIKDEREKQRLEEEMCVLKKKVTLGWILGCLSEVYLRMDGENESQKGAKTIGNILKNAEKPTKLECIEREVRRLINSQEFTNCPPKKCSTSSPRQISKGLEEECFSPCGGKELDLDASFRPCRHHCSGSRSSSPNRNMA